MWVKSSKDSFYNPLVITSTVITYPNPIFIVFIKLDEPFSVIVNMIGFFGFCVKPISKLR